MIVLRVAITALLTGVVIYFSGCSAPANDKNTTTQIIPVQVKISTPESLSGKTTEVSGRVEAMQSANVSTRMMGYITGIHVKMGDRVSRGQLLVTINNADLLAKKMQAEAGITQAEAALKVAEKDFDRYTVLYNQQSVSEKELENITLQYKSAKAAFDIARQMRNEITAQLSYANITAPFDGVITHKYMDAGNMASPGMPILSIEANGKLQAVGAIPEFEVSNLKTGQEASVTISAANSTVKGKILEISNSSNSNGGMYMVKVSLPDDNKQILAGMYVNISFSSGSENEKNADIADIYIPLTSVVRKGDLEGIYTVGASGQALLRWLRLGRVKGDKVEVLSGLTKKESFIVHADGNLYNGAPVKVN